MSTETKPEKSSYKTTLNLPQTAFPMEAKLVANEPARLKLWEESHLYTRIQMARSKSGRGKWILHDGPPFANGDIHIGHVVNKTLKDVILKFRTMQGYQTPYVPGWDCHGLPIEHKIAEEIKKEGKNIREMSTLEVRKRCYEYAEKYVNIQAEQFKRLGIFGEWSNPYLTMKPAYEASTLNVFAKFVEAGLVYRKLKPVPWSIANQTALADAELEYQDVNDISVYVEFPLVSPLAPGSAGVEPPQSGGLTEKESLLIWTTTPWTLPANLAVAVGPDVDYARVSFSVEGRSKTIIVAVDLVEKVFALDGSVEPKVIGVVKGSELIGATYQHPFVDRVGRVVGADYVTTTDGTGLVHTAPGHGEDDYETGLREKLEVYSPVLANGRFDDTVPEWLRGKSVMKEGNPLIIEHLKASGHLFAEQTIRHSYPHDWRSKTPIIFRATEQWFVAMDKAFTPSPGTPGEGRGEGEFERKASLDVRNHPHPNPLPGYRERGPEKTLRDRAVAVADRSNWEDIVEEMSQADQPLSGTVRFIPRWGAARLHGMLESRPDWCVSRQRAWGLPIPVFYNDKGEALLTPESVRAIAKRVEEFGSDCWFKEEPAVLLGADFVYPPGFTPTNLRKEKDIFDVWFESGSSWAAVLQARSYLQFPADLYLEGSDQHRGWFQLSLLPALGATGRPPFKQVLTHGFVVKPDGTKVSKSDKEYVTATKEINTHGADVLRLWCCSVDYQNDIPASPKALQEFGDKYRKIRNTLRYLLSNLYDFNASTQSVPVPVNSLDGWIIDQHDTLIAEVTAAYDTYQLHRAFRLLHDFCSVQISSIYGNAMKDRLYCEAANSPLRRRCQTVMHKLVLALSKLLAPMIAFTADETWCHIPHRPADEIDLPSVHMTLLPMPTGQAVTEQTRADWALLMQLRDSALGQLDALKKSAGLNKASESELVYHLPDDVRQRLGEYGVDLEDLAGGGHVSFAPATTPAITIVDAREKYQACARCWKRRPDVGSDAEYPDLCGRDAAAMRILKG
jgi:isoleucyl-tRNA synthetase